MKSAFIEASTPITFQSEVMQVIQGNFPAIDEGVVESIANTIENIHFSYSKSVLDNSGILQQSLDTCKEELEELKSATIPKLLLEKERLDTYNSELMEHHRTIYEELQAYKRGEKSDACDHVSLNTSAEGVLITNHIQLQHEEGNFTFICKKCGKSIK